MRAIIVLVLALIVTVSVLEAKKISFSALSPQSKDLYKVKETSNKEIELTESGQDLVNNYNEFVQDQSNLVQKLRNIVVDESANVLQDMGDFGQQDVPVLSLDELSTIINYAKEAWGFIEANRAVVNSVNFFGNALPKGVSSAFDLYGWDAPVQSSWSAEWKNVYGMTVGKIDYTLSFIPNGKAEATNGGVGLFLDRVTILPTSVYVFWGYTADASASISSTTNVGTRDAPIAAVTIDLTLKITALATEVVTHSFYVRADGQFKSLNPS
jgi:hypothetical protein